MYTRNDPVNMIDPTGESFVSWIKENVVQPIAQTVDEYLIQPAKTYIVNPAAKAINKYVFEPVQSGCRKVQRGYANGKAKLKKKKDKLVQRGKEIGAKAKEKAVIAGKAAKDTVLVGANQFLEWRQRNLEENYTESVKLAKEILKFEGMNENDPQYNQRLEQLTRQHEEAFNAALGSVGELKVVGGAVSKGPAVVKGIKSLVKRVIGKGTGNVTFKKYMKLANELDVSTGRNQAVFYSGKGNRELAEAFAKEHRKLTLEMTPGGQYLDELKLFSNDSHLTVEQAQQVWSRLSQRYAQQASGNIVGFVKGARPNSIFNTVEYPVLVNNPNVTNVITGGY